jgi:3-deoxy-manno-octulosonate cytidylyltransferase (CMP-KDO synthetase)
MESNDFVICIPARYQSTRLPGKPLLEISGKPLILWAIESALKLNAKQTIVATDDAKIYDYVVSQGFDVVMTSPHHPTGTDRIAEVAELMNWSNETIVVNYQGDEPLTPKANVLQLVKALQQNTSATISTLYKHINSFEDLINPNYVKLISDNNDVALYFSRSAIPYSRSYFDQHRMDPNINYKHHIGLYAYRTEFLKNFSKLKPSALEATESLEQLRALSNGYKIITKLAKETMPNGIDTSADVVKFANYLKENIPNKKL